MRLAHCFMQEKIFYQPFLKSDSKIKAFYAELNIRKNKWLFSCSYNQNKTFNTKHLVQVGRNQDLFLSKYDKLILLGGFSPSCIELFISNKPKSFQNSTVRETGLPDFYKMPLTVRKVFNKKQLFKIVKSRN